MDAPTDRYHQVARVFRDHPLTSGREIIPQPATAEDLAWAEAALGCRFPLSYQWFQLEFGDVLHGPLDIYSVKPIQSLGWNIVGINLGERAESYPPLPVSLIAFSDSGGGDFLCFDTSVTTSVTDAGLAAGEYPVVWWDHEGEADQIPEPAGDSFLDWLEAELRARDAEDPGSLLEGLQHVYRGWLQPWLGSDSK
jgi:hypothetical protein